MRKLITALMLSLALGLAAAASAGPVNINTADAKTLAKELDGVGAARAKAIIEYREKHGAFKSADDLKKVVGIGPATVERNRAKIVVDATASPKAASPGQ